jgi:hypothetical protein
MARLLTALNDKITFSWDVTAALVDGYTEFERTSYLHLLGINLKMEAASRT